MRVLIVGASGQLGRAFQELLTRKGIEHFPLGRAELDVTDLSRVREAVRGIRPTHIVNCAAYTDVDKAEEDWRRAYAVNGLGVRNLALGAREVKAELVHFSSDYVFSGRKASPYTIFDPPDPINRYGESKLLGERFVELAEKWYLIRTSWVFGKGERNFPRKVLLWAKTKEVLRFATDEVSAPTYTRDLAEAALLLMEQQAFGLYHVTNTPASRFEWASYILRRIGWTGKIEEGKQEDFPSPARRPKFSVLDNFGLWETVGVELPTWQEATERFLREEGFL
jgi:dTDP-4-dehydrorhamnose reductase